MGGESELKQAVCSIEHKVLVWDMWGSWLWGGGGSDGKSIVIEYRIQYIDRDSRAEHF